MLQIQQNYQSVLTDAKNEAGKTQILQGHLGTLESLGKEISAQELLVPIIGGFSAGKSSLLNEFLGEKILDISISPETSIATELRHSKEPRIEAVKDDGSVKKFNIDELKAVVENAQDYNYIRLFLDNKKLKDIEPLILVDMPGFRSATTTHIKAIDRYMPMGVYFIALLSAKDEGSVTQSFLSDLKDINKRGKKFAFCLSKTNLLTQSDAQEVADNVKGSLDAHGCDYENEIYLLGKGNSGEVLGQILSKIDKEDIFARIFEARIKKSLNEMIASIDETIKGMRFDKDEARRYLEELDESIKNIENEERKFLEGGNERVKKAEIDILEALREKLEAKTGDLVSAALKSEGAFGQELESVVSSTLKLAFQEHFQGTSFELIDNLTSQVKNLKFDTNVETWADTLKDIVDTLSFVGIPFTGGIPATLSKIPFLGRIIALLQSKVFSSIIKGLSRFLPKILSDFVKDKKIEEMKNKFKNVFIDDILDKIRPELLKILQEQDAELTKALGDEFKQKMQEKQQEIRTAQKEKEAKLSEIEGEIKGLELVKENIINTAKSVL